MSLAASLSGVHNAIINHMTGYTTDNCSVHDEAVFNYIQSTVDAPTKCCIIAYDGAAGGNRTEFRSAMINWKILVNAFFMIVGDDYLTPISDSIAFVDSVVALCATNPFLDNTVMKATVMSGSEPLVYARASFNYILVSVTIDITDNIGG